MEKIKYKKLTKNFSPRKLKFFYDKSLPGKTLNQCKNVIKKSLIIGAFDGDELVGISRGLDDSVYGFITDVIVRPDYRGRGMGKKITKIICKSLRRRGVKMIHCSTKKGLTNFFKSAEKFENDSNDTTLYCKNF
jgi:ribosomal protein S18 acetylase RimI-like enzyme